MLCLLQAIVKALWSGQELGWVVESPRTHHQLSPNVLEQEEKRGLHKVGKPHLIYIEQTKAI